jgi:flagellar biogenesis protein FliO
LTAFGLVIALAWIVMRINRQIEERLGLDGD